MLSRDPNDLTESQKDSLYTWRTESEFWHDRRREYTKRAVAMGQEAWVHSDGGFPFWGYFPRERRMLDWTWARPSELAAIMAKRWRT